ncbi:FliM/FliN family flagellar motor switch protein, partial [bacterium]|nr:FliM/FliN family flagellar motor switch protein [bacterium]MBU1613709.1 FliM/FliN family flagellar motor switch protein [bacterium]
MEEKNRLTEDEVKALLAEEKEPGGVLKKEDQGIASPPKATPSHQIKTIQFAQVSPTGVSQASDIGLLSNVAGIAGGQLGSAKMSFREVLEMQPGDVIELNRLAGEDIDLLINDKSVAKGTVIVTDEDKLGVRITEL